MLLLQMFFYVDAAIISAVPNAILGHSAFGFLPLILCPCQINQAFLGGSRQIIFCSPFALVVLISLLMIVSVKI